MKAGSGKGMGKFRVLMIKLPIGRKRAHWSIKRNRGRSTGKEVGEKGNAT